MKRAFLLLLFVASTMQAQTTLVGGRYSNYSTDLDFGIATLDTGRASSLGFIASHRNGNFVLNGSVEHDFESGVNLGDFLPIDFAEYQRDRGELSVGFGVAPILDIEGAVRLDNMSLGGDFFGQSFFDDLEFEHQAIGGGVTLHSQTVRPFGWYGTVRGYIGSADFEFEGVEVSSDTSGFKLEAGIPIPVGVTGWEVTPGLEWEHLETDQFGVEFDTNRFFINFGYVIGR